MDFRVFVVAFQDFGSFGVFVVAFVNFMDFGVFFAAVDSGHK